MKSWYIPKRKEWVYNSITNLRGALKMIDKRLGKNIQKYRELAGKSQEELSEYIGVSVTSISNIERGANYPSFENFIKILNFINASPNMVMFDMVEQAQITRASELWEKMKKLSAEERNKIFKIIEVMTEE